MGTGATGAAGIARAAGVPEHPPDRPPQFGPEKSVDQRPVGELGVSESESDPGVGILAEPPGLRHRGARRGQRVPRAAGRVLGKVLHRVDEMRDPAEQSACLLQRFRVLRPSREQGR